MPTYDVKCKSCEIIYEIEHSIVKDHPPCKECQGELGTYFSRPPGISFKGDGWTGKHYGVDTTAKIRDRTNALQHGGTVNDPDD